MLKPSRPFFVDNVEESEALSLRPSAGCKPGYHAELHAVFTLAGVLCCWGFFERCESCSTIYKWGSDYLSGEQGGNGGGGEAQRVGQDRGVKLSSMHTLFT